MADAGAFLLGLYRAAAMIFYAEAGVFRRKKKPILKTMAKNGKIAVFIRHFVSFVREVLVR